MKSKGVATIFAAALLTLCSGCSIHFSPGGNMTFNDSFHYSAYANAERYSAGDFTYSAAEISEVRVHWVAGQIHLTEKEDAELSVYESAEGLSEDAQLHYTIQDNVLTIHYCASDYRGKIKGESKQLSLEIPAGVTLTISSVSAPILAETLTSSSLDMETVSGGVSIHQLTGDNADFSTVSGNIDIDAADVKKLSLAAVSGEFNVEKLTVDQLKAETVSGDMEFEFLACREAALETVSGETNLTLPAEGGTVRFDTISGELMTERLYQRQDHFYGFGPADCKISVSSTSGDLAIE